MQIDLNGRTALVTGGSLGIGRAIAEGFAAAGASVAIVARRQQVLDQAAQEIVAATGGRVHAIACDVRDPAQIEQAHAGAVEALGPIDILVNNAGTSRTGKFQEITDEVWHEDLDLKLFAAIRLIRLALPGMRERGWGRILNVLNIGAKAPRAGGAPTVVSRAAGLALTKALAGEVAPDGVLVNALCTGLVVSDQWLQRHLKSGSNESFEQYTAKMGETIPLGRMGTAQEFANLACFLASDAGSYITGTAINVDGGLSPVP